MTAITAGLVRELREATGAGMMDCKKALTENNGDMEAATDWLRVKGLSKAAKKSDRAAVDGLVAVKVDGMKGSVLEVNAETDFVARNESFQEFVSTLASLTLTSGADVAELNDQQYPGVNRSVAEELADKIATIGENMNIRRSKILEVADGVVVSYMHNPVVDGLGKIGVLI
ncbi:MAG: translation elongation factor Ts, partial [Alphaproteobacteria bacterium]